jgi:hypothetical protein
MAAPKLRTSQKVLTRPAVENSAALLVPVNFSPENRLTTETAADYLGIRGETLARWRSERRELESQQPNFYRVGKKIFYLKCDLDRFLLSRGESALAISRVG